MAYIRAVVWLKKRLDGLFRVMGWQNAYFKPKVVSCLLIDEMTPSLGKAPCPTLSVKPGHYQARVVRSSI